MTEAGGPDGCRALVLQLVVTMSDGSVVRHGTNTNDWQVRQGPIVWDHLFHGETYDATFELSDWVSSLFWHDRAGRTACACASR